METRVIWHDEKHYDIEALFPVMEEGVWLDVWAVIYCNENQKMVQAQQAERPTSNACGCIQDLPPVMETAKTKHLEEVMNSMKQYRITYTRPYLPEPECSEPQRTVVNAESEDEVNKIYEDCKITFIEEVVPAEAAYQQEFSDDDPRTPAERAADEDWEDYQETIRSIYKDLGVW